jgi:hypothetical protein
VPAIPTLRNLQDLLLNGAPLPFPPATRSASTEVSTSSSARADEEFCSICYCEEDSSTTRKQSELVTCNNRRCHHKYHSDRLRGWLHACLYNTKLLPEEDRAFKNNVQVRAVIYSATSNICSQLCQYSSHNNHHVPIL